MRKIYTRYLHNKNEVNRGNPQPYVFITIMLQSKPFYLWGKYQEPISSVAPTLLMEGVSSVRHQHDTGTRTCDYVQLINFFKFLPVLTCLMSVFVSMLYSLYLHLCLT